MKKALALYKFQIFANPVQKIVLLVIGDKMLINVRNANQAFIYITFIAIRIVLMVFYYLNYLNYLKEYYEDTASGLCKPCTGNCLLCSTSSTDCITCKIDSTLYLYKNNEGVGSCWEAINCPDSTG